MKVAVIHDWCVIYGGAERVLEHILDSYPQADLFTLFDFVPEDQRHFMRGKKPKTSFLQKVPGMRKYYRKFLPLMPLAIEQFDLSEYDLVISSSYCVAKGIMTGPNQVHVSYCHSPMRYAWDHYHEYLKETGLTKGPLSWLVRILLHRIRTWDVRSSNSVDQFIANSEFVRARIKKFYNRTSSLLFPPIETDIFKLEHNKDDYYVTAGRFVPFKRLDIAVEAFTKMPDKKLVVIGDGPEMSKLKDLAGDNIEFLGFQPPEVMREHMSRARAFIFPSEEDFGIVPVEAQACGTPVIAFGSGGALETVIPLEDSQNKNKVTGMFFNEQKPDSLIQTVNDFENKLDYFDPVFISNHAASFSPANFKKALKIQVLTAIEENTYVKSRLTRKAAQSSRLSNEDNQPPTTSTIISAPSSESLSDTMIDNIARQAAERINTPAIFLKD